jgi:hypothetical protein
MKWLEFVVGRSVVFMVSVRRMVAPVVGLVVVR